jgi:hypothetical protein
MQCVEVTGLSVRSAVISMCRRETPLKFALFPVFHVASPAFYRQVRARLRDCDLIVAEAIEGSSHAASGPAVSPRIAPRLRRNGLALQDDSTLFPDGVAVVRPDGDDARSGAGAETSAPPGRRHGLTVLTAPLAGLLLAIRGPRMFFGEDLAVDDPPPNRRTDHTKAADSPAKADGQCDGQLYAALGRIHREHSREPITVGVVYDARHIPAIAHDLNANLGYRPRESEWLTVAVLARHRSRSRPRPA